MVSQADTRVPTKGWRPVETQKVSKDLVEENVLAGYTHRIWSINFVGRRIGDEWELHENMYSEVVSPDGLQLHYTLVSDLEDARQTGRDHVRKILERRALRSLRLALAR